MNWSNYNTIKMSFVFSVTGDTDRLARKSHICSHWHQKSYHWKKLHNVKLKLGGYYTYQVYEDIFRAKISCKSLSASPCCPLYLAAGWGGRRLSCATTRTRFSSFARLVSSRLAAEPASVVLCMGGRGISIKGRKGGRNWVSGEMTGRGEEGW